MVLGWVLQKLRMYYLCGFGIGVLLFFPYTCNGQVFCRTDCSNDLTRTCALSPSLNVSYCECKDGYRYNEALKCEDIDECKWDVCGSQKCNNLPGTYKCGDSCDTGYQPGKIECIDINECKFPVCGESGTCINYRGLYTCRCYFGFQLINDRCFDIDECSTLKVCGSSSTGTCTNTLGSYRCICNDGYELLKNLCVDMDECSTPNICGSSSAGKCDNIVGSYTCECYAGYQLSDIMCVDINECLTPDLCGSADFGSCVNLRGRYGCNCNSGYQSDGIRPCTDIDECLTTPNVCGTSSSGSCVNLPGTYNCTCSSGYQFDSTRTCTDIDECLTSDICESSAGPCVNTPGSYTCGCVTGYQLVNNTCKAVTDSFSGSENGQAGQKIGLAVGVVVGTAVLVIIGVIVLIRYRKKKKEDNRKHVNADADVNELPQPKQRNSSNNNILSSTSDNAKARADIQSTHSYVNVNDHMNTSEADTVTYEEISTTNPLSAVYAVTHRDGNNDHDYTSIRREGGTIDHAREGTTAGSAQYEAVCPGGVQPENTYSSLRKKDNDEYVNFAGRKA